LELIYIHLYFVVSCVKYIFNLIDHIKLVSLLLLQPFNFKKKSTWGPCHDTKTLTIVHSKMITCLNPTLGHIILMPRRRDHEALAMPCEDIVTSILLGDLFKLLHRP
jgi:hypothetical protein